MSNSNPDMFSVADENVNLINFSLGVRRQGSEGAERRLIRPPWGVIGSLFRLLCDCIVRVEKTSGRQSKETLFQSGGLWIWRGALQSASFIHAIPVALLCWLQYDTFLIFNTLSLSKYLLLEAIDWKRIQGGNNLLWFVGCFFLLTFSAKLLFYLFIKSTLLWYALQLNKYKESIIFFKGHL